ncbi:hypothetical protein DB30_08019 [Enhygromyxa salina]|uniref:Uncharacterized protein n=1 Tax=Enhygromyxa salina TaxID=215803 RepID=A0A0C2D029_9BACT|nr:hypothetical protein DB30_08019 [Enhygromyxa salina]
MWVAGFSGASARYDGEAWHCAEQPLTYEHCHEVWRHSQQGRDQGRDQDWGRERVGPISVLDSCE